MTDRTLFFIILLCYVSVQALINYQIHKQLFRHQKAIEWFAVHVRLDPRSIPGEAPKELYDLLDLKDKEVHVDK